MNIALCMNSKYVMPSLVCIMSILENNKDPVNIYVLYSQLKKEEIEFMRVTIERYNTNNSLIPIKIDDTFFENSPTLGRSKEAYFRLLIPTVLPESVERCLYLDSDILVQGNLAPLYNEPFNDNALIVCQDIGEFLFFHKERHPILKIPTEYNYFNSGVLLFNMNYFRTGFDRKLFFDYINKNADKLKFLDQDVLNALFYNKVTFANSSLYNYMEILVSHLLTNSNMDKAVIVHFLQKPWKFTYNGVNGKYWWRYARKVYKTKYIVFSIVNFLYRKFLGLVLLVVSVQDLKKIKGFISVK